MFRPFRRFGTLVLCLGLLAAGLVTGHPAATGRQAQRGAATTHLTHARLSAAFRYADAGVLAYGSASYHGSPWNKSVTSPVVAMAANPSGKGYWLVTASGVIYAYGNARSYGSLAGRNLAAPVSSIAVTANGRGYWLVTEAGGVYSFGDARGHGSHVEHPVGSPIVQIVATNDGGGYWLLSADGHVHAFGDARFHGETTTKALYAVAMASTKDGKGYWIAFTNGVVEHFGDARSYNFTKGGKISSTWVTGFATDESKDGYWLEGANGTVAAYGHAGYFGSNAKANPTEPDAGMVAAANGRGYLLLEPDAFKTIFTQPGGGTVLGRRIVADAANRVFGDSRSGTFCNAFGPCEEWCALFATAIWEAAGVNIPRYAFTGDIFYWSNEHTRVTGPGGTPKPGWDVLYGTGPSTVNTSLHVGVIAQVWRDGFIDTVEGDAGPAKWGHYGVVINGPFLVSQSKAYNDMPVYALAAP